MCGRAFHDHQVRAYFLGDFGDEGRGGRMAADHLDADRNTAFGQLGHLTLDLRFEVFLVDAPGAAAGPAAGRAHPPADVTGTHVLRRDRLGGLIHEYSQVA